MDCKEYMMEQKELMKATVSAFDVKPVLSIVQVGNNFESDTYVKWKLRDCEEIGITANLIHFEEDASENEVFQAVLDLNATSDGIIIQLPLPAHMDVKRLQRAIELIHDVDGFLHESPFVSCTPLGVMNIMKANQIDLVGANVVVIGRSNIVGKPMAKLLLDANATVTICHSHTKNLAKHTLDADVIISAAGVPNLITADMIKENAVVIDVGMNRVNGKLCGDVDYENVKDKCSFITKTPGGTGLTTRCALLQNTIQAYLNAREE